MFVNPDDLNYKDPNSLVPVPKIAAAGGLGIPLAVLTVWLLGFAGVDVPTEVQSALAAVVTVVVGYLKP